ncbi:MAG: Fic family protein [Flavobacteriales bacterium]|nr:Fic family protein [Flavobacteriales bacterium]
MIGNEPLSDRELRIMDIVRATQPVSIAAIHAVLGDAVSRPTLNRDLVKLCAAGWLQRSGVGKATRYALHDRYSLFGPVDLRRYFERDPDVRDGRRTYNFEVMDLLRGQPLFSLAERQTLEQARQTYQDDLQRLPAVLYRKELQRLTIELSWKSAQIEGNTYTLLETERLLSEQEEARGRTRAEAIMLLNHKRVFEEIVEHGLPDQGLTVGYIASIHAVLMKGLEVGQNIRTRAVGITGTAYRPLDNDHQIREQLEALCHLVNAREDGFERALLAVLLISYIQPFEDGNKRTARMIGNALLLHYQACPLSYRSVDPVHYKEAMLLFYEQNNVSAFKALFLQQVQFASEQYFR